MPVCVCGGGGGGGGRQGLLNQGEILSVNRIFQPGKVSPSGETKQTFTRDIYGRVHIDFCNPLTCGFQKS